MNRTPLKPQVSSLKPVASSRGFTLIELLMVIAIIGVLMALLAVALVPAMRNARVAEVKTEVDLLSNAMERYKSEFGAYPPSPGTLPFSAYPGGGSELPADRKARVQNHFRKAFPRFIVSDTAFNTAFEDAGQPVAEEANGWIGYSKPSAISSPLKLENLDAAEALVFFLGGLPQWSLQAGGNEYDPADWSVQLTGFSANPQNPLHNEMAQSQRTEPLFEFKPGRLTDYDNDNWPEYIPPGTSTQEMPPYVYFDASMYARGAWYSDIDVTWGIAAPYAANVNTSPALNDPQQWVVTAWVNPDTFQIISAGRDEKFGGDDPATALTPKVFPSGLNYAPGGLEADNITNFASGVLGDDKD